MKKDKASGGIAANPKPSMDLEQLRESTLAALRQEIQHQRQSAALQRDERRRQGDEAFQLLQDCGVERQRLDRLEAQEQEQLNRYLDGIRPGLVESPPRPRRAESDEAPHAALLAELGPTLTPVKSDVLTQLRSTSEAEFTTLSRRDLKASMSGSGWGCWVEENPAYPDTMAYWWYSYTPSTTRSYNFWVSAPYAGFYVIRADDSWYNCKYAKSYAFYEVDVYQHYWRGADRRTVIDRRDDNINQSGQVAGAIYWFFSQPLLANIPVTVRVTATLDVYAQGGGSYAELNFADGADHYLDPPAVIIY